MADESRSRKRPCSEGFYDEMFPPHQRLPRKFSVRVEELDTDPASVALYCRGRQIGNELTDNSHGDDGYRFHDVFHLAYATHLRWSPVARKLLKRKRRSVRRIDEVEDGGRATVIEEGIAALVFDDARRQDFYEGARNVDSHLIDTILNLVSPYEVASASATQWERAILDGFLVWRKVRAHRGGVVFCDLNARSFRFEPLGTSIFTKHGHAQSMGATHWALPPPFDANDLNLAVLLRREARARCPYCSKRRILWQPINQEGGGDAVCTECQLAAGWPEPRRLPCPYPTHVGISRAPRAQKARVYLEER